MERELGKFTMESVKVILGRLKKLKEKRLKIKNKGIEEVIFKELKECKYDQSSRQKKKKKV